MDGRVEIDDEEFDELLRDVQGSPHEVKQLPSNKASAVSGQKSVCMEYMNEVEIDELLQDVEWTEDSVKATPKTATIPEPKPNHLEILRKNFGHAKFRPMQWEIIYNIIESKRDGCVVMATGYGKSLCYQFPPVFCEGTALVITPLISLMEDQTLALEAASIPACYLGAGQAGQGTKMDKLVCGDYRVVYLTPEFCTGDAGQNLFDRLLPSKKITLVAIDEAHCVSQWGHDFRHSYRKLGKIRDKLGYSVPILALTATATNQVQDDICSSLKLRNHFRFCSGFDRPNLYLAVHSKGTSIINDLRRHMVKGEMNFEGSTIVYCPTKRVTENVAKALEENGVNCRFYHADLNPKVRKEVHHMFVRDEIQVIVATVAFGMGIDKPDVRLIIHYGAPKDMESYYQEVGRAGRDGLQSQCYCYYTNSDFNTNQYFLSNLTGKAYEHRKVAMLKMEQYLQSRQCRRQFLLSHFEPEKSKTSEKPPENCCDNCTFKRVHGNTEPEIAGLNEDGTYDFREDTELLLSAVNFFGGRFGITNVITFLCGGKSCKFRDDEMQSEVFGKGKHKPKEWWRGLGRILLQEGFLEEVASKYNAPGRFPFHTVKVGIRGLDVMHRSGKEKAPINLHPSGDMLNVIKKGQRKVQFPVSTSWNEPVILPLFPTSSQSDSGSKKEEPQMTDEETEKEGKLYCELLKLRNDLAKKHSYMPYMVANNKTLLDVAAMRPSSPSDLALVEGFNAAKIAKFGAAIVEKVGEFCAEHGLALKKIPEPVTETTCVNFNEQQSIDITAIYSSIPPSVKTSYEMFQMQGMDLAAIVAERKFSEKTIGNHLAEALRAGLPLDIERLGVTDRIQEIIVQAIRSPPINSDISRLKPIKENCPRHITYEQIKITLALLSHKYELKDNINTDASDLSVFKHVPTEKNTLSRQSTSETVSKISKSPPVQHNQEPATKKRRFDLNQFMQKNFKDSPASTSDIPSTVQKTEVSPKEVPKNDNSHLWGDDDVFACVDVDSKSVSVPESTKQNRNVDNLKQKPKEFHQEMKKKMKTSSLFRK